MAAFGRIRLLVDRIRENCFACMLAVVATAAVVGAGALVLKIADRENGLREVQTEIAELSRLTTGLREQTLTSFHPGNPGHGDAALRSPILATALGTAHQIEMHWSDPSVEGIDAATRALGRTSRAALADTDGHRARANAELFQVLVQAENLLGRLTVAGRKVSETIAAEKRNAEILTFTVTGLIGLFLSALIVVVSSMWRRRQRGAEEERAAVLGQQRLQALVRHGSDLICVLSAGGEVLFAAGAVESMLGREAAELEGESLAAWLHPDDTAVLAALCDIGEGESPSRELRLRRRDGSYRICEARAANLLDDDLWNGIVLNIWDVTQRVALEERLRHQAFHDDLTALANRVLFKERLEHALIRAVRTGRTVSVLVIDVDDFKAVNDSLGHSCGDELLREVAARFDRAMRGADTVARLGGDEFGVILDDSDSVEGDEEAARRIIAAMAPPFPLSGRCLPVSASVGVARAAAGTATAPDLIRDADLAMYAAKAEQKGTFAVYRDDMYHGAEERLQLKSDLLDAAAGDGEQFSVFYQPVVELQSGEVAGLEALLRWHHPSKGMVSPAEFIPIAEETGAIVPIGRRVLLEACEEAQRWRPSSDGRGLAVSVNVSARQLRDNALVAHVREALDRSGLMPKRLILEITETQLMQNVDEAVATLFAAKELGVRVAIDDFGTGYSSLSQLQRLPADILKVDREFTGSGDGAPEHAGLLNAVMEIGESLRLRTVAEGIETPAQLRQLRALNYRFGQGFLFSRPVPADAVAELLARPTLVGDDLPGGREPDPEHPDLDVHLGYLTAVQNAREVRAEPHNLRLGANRPRRDLRLGRTRRAS